MRILSLLAICGTVMLAGCGGDATETTSNTTANDPALADRSTGEGGSASTSDNANSEANSGLRAFPLSPENTTIQFVGTHVTEDGGPDPNARTGVFTEFSGQAGVDPETNELQSVSVEIQTKSLQTPIDRLNGHLSGPDFFDVNVYPTAKFASTQITPATGDSATHTITGELTLLNTTKEITFPATVNVNEDGVSLDASFALDRTDYGINYDPGRVNKEVTMTVISEKTEPPQASGGFGGGGGGRGRGGFDPAAMFARMDADGDGKLVGDEIPDRMRDNLANIDTDSNGEITSEEFQQSMARFGGQRGGDRSAGNDPPAEGGQDEKPQTE
jgi:polyisoprenoid-binding protein YceI